MRAADTKKKTAKGGSDDGEATGAVWENPLMPNARLRQIYLAMTRARTLARALPRGRGQATTGLEACLASAAVDLGPDDLVSDALAGGVVDFLRGTPLNEVMRRGRGGMRAECGQASRLPEAPGAAARVWTGLGAAATLKAVTARAKAETRDSSQMGVAVAYLLADELEAGKLREALTFAREKELPAVFVVLPLEARGGKASAAKLARVTALALGCGLPGIPVDADDAVAIYRVAQESIGHARTGGGPAVMVCVPFVLAGEAGRRALAADAIRELEKYMLTRGVATRPWMERETRSFVRRVEAGKSASKKR